VNVSDSLGKAFEAFGGLAFRDGYVLGGVASATRTPQRIAAWPMFADPPGCWLHLAGGADRLSWPAGRSATLTAFPMPPADPAFVDAMRGRVYSLVVFHDRPEVRQFVGSLLPGGLSTSVAGSLLSGGLWPAGDPDPGIRLDEGTRQEGERLWRAIRAGTFRVGASDLVPTSVATAFEQGAVHYLTAGPFSLGTVLGDIADRWDESK
jgi:alpha-glucoside transport system substrate-binding protein